MLQQSDRLHEAVSAYSSAIRFRPKLALAHLNLGLTLSRLGRTEEAIKILDAGSKLDDNGLKDPATNANARSSALWHLGKLLLEAGDPHRAVTVLQTRVTEDRVSGRRSLENIHNLLGEAHQALGHQDKAEAWFTSALKSDPNYVPAQLMMAKMLAKNVRGYFVSHNNKANQKVSVTLKSNPLIFHFPRFNVRCFSLNCSTKNLLVSDFNGKVGSPVC